MIGDEPFELGYDPMVLPEGEDRLRSLLHRHYAHLVEPIGLGEKPPLGAELAVRATPPQGERPIVDLQRPPRLLSTGLGEQRLELLRVDRRITEFEVIPLLDGRYRGFPERRTKP